MDQLDEIKNKIDIIDLVSEHLTLKKAGRNFKGLCPFHNEKTPSFIVSPDRQIFHCFGCQSGGDIFGFLMKVENIEFVEALRLLAKRAGIELKSQFPNARDNKKELLYEINHLASEYYHFVLTQTSYGKNGLKYLLDRGITKNSIDLFRLGFAPNSWESLSKYLVGKKGYQPADLELAGLTVKSSYQEKANYDRFRNRIIFPLKDHRGNILGFSGRLLNPNIKEAKYINSPETPIYLKSNHLYGLDLAKDDIKKENLAIITEGEIDLISSYQVGIKNVVAIKGSALTQGHVTLLKRYTQNIAFALDSDFAGNEAAKRGIEIADSVGLNMKVVTLIFGKDPDECIKKDPALWHESIKKALPIYDYLLNSILLTSDPASPEGKKKIAETILPTISKITNEIVKSHYIKKIASLLDVKEEVIISELGKLSKIQNWQKVKPLSPASQNTSAPKSREEMFEEYLLSLLIQSSALSELLNFTLNLINPEDFTTPIYQKIISHLAGLKNENLDLQKIVTLLPKELIPTLDRLYLLDHKLNLDDPEILKLEIKKVSKQILEISLKTKIKELISKIKITEAEDDLDSVEKYKKEFFILSEKLQQIKSP